MPLMREKKLNLAGFQIGIGVNADRVESIRNSGIYQRFVRPAMGLVRKPNHTSNHANGASPRPGEGTPFRPQRPPVANIDPEAARIWDKISDIGWYHTIDLPHGVTTPGFIDNRPTVHSFGIPEDLSGKRCLDIGTYDGFWAFEMERRGASESIGIDVDSPADYDIPRPLRLKAQEDARQGPHILEEGWNRQMASVGMEWPGRGFQVAAEILGSKARRASLDAYDLKPESLGTFDVLLISQLLLRMRDPQTVLENMASVTRPGGMAIVAEGYDIELEQLSRPVSEFVGLSNMGMWWAHSIKSMQKIMETAGFERVEVVARFPAENRVGRFAKVVLRGTMG